MSYMGVVTCEPIRFKRHNVRVIRAANPVGRRMTERGKISNPEYSIFRDQPIARASPLRINTLLSGRFFYFISMLPIAEERSDSEMRFPKIAGFAEFPAL